MGSTTRLEDLASMEFSFLELEDLPDLSPTTYNL